MMLDGTLGVSYFERFEDVKNMFLDKTGILKSVAFQILARKKEVNYDRFVSSYWPRFNAQLTKMLEPSRVFTEIISHIKGGLQAGATCDGKVSRDDYLLLSEARTSTLNKQKREIIYDIFEDYEKMKRDNGHFDIADLVNDLHRRLRSEKYKADEIDFVYIDEVQDLTMRQISLFKYVCKNVEEGFVFSGDPQTIARGIDFRFQDIKSLFYNEFIRGQLEKGKISPIFQLSNNFRTHAGVLKLAQSVIDLLYRFFPQSIDILSPETSRIYGEAPVLLESGNNENAIITIFGKSGATAKSVVGFGAEQVILVRDESAREEISVHVGKQALVLTIVECKGLEFQDVLLYNFFGSSPLKNRWRVIYEYMEEQNLLDATSTMKFPCFNQAKHNILCSELKHLYVAITRTRQRLWICENVEELSKPIFNYWQKLNLVQVAQLDDSLAQAMQVASSPDEWRSRGLKLLNEHNYQMATMCFERAGDTYWEKFAKAAGLRAAADRMQTSNPEMARHSRREAADIFEFIGKADAAAECFYLLEEFERAGRIYFEKCGDAKLAVAGECFSRAGCYGLSAEVYAKGNFFAECLSVCSKGKLFEAGLKYIEYWKKNATQHEVMGSKSMEIGKIEQNFLESCALHYHKLKDNRTMMKFVKNFHTTSTMRTFLKSVDCIDELLQLEEESGNFVEAAAIAKSIGNHLSEADLLAKAGLWKEASLQILWYILAYSLWSPGNKGWPLKQFGEKDKLLEKASNFAKNDSELFHEAICTETVILSNSVVCLAEMKQHLDDSVRHESIRGEILSTRRILDYHLRLNVSKYDWENMVVADLKTHSNDNLFHNRVSIETLVYFWNLWKEKIEIILEYLVQLGKGDVKESNGYGEFCLNHLGVWRQCYDLDVKYILFDSDVGWTRDIDQRSLSRSGKLVSVEVRQFITIARTHWCSQLFSVGQNVLEVLESLYNFSIKTSTSAFIHAMPLAYIFDVAKYLSECNFLDHRHHGLKTLNKFLQLSTDNFSALIFPFNWRKPLAANLVSFRGTELCKNLLMGIISESIDSKAKPTYGQIGRVVLKILGLGKLNGDMHMKVEKCFDSNIPWKVFIESLRLDNKPDVNHKVSLGHTLCAALRDTYYGNWRGCDYISPDCFLYLVERLLVLVSFFQGHSFTTKDSLVELLIYQDWDARSVAGSSSDNVTFLEPILDTIAYFVQQLLLNQQDTLGWIAKSGIKDKDYHPFMVLRLFVILCLLCLNFGRHYDMLFGLLSRRDITWVLPKDFYLILRKKLNPTNAVKTSNMIADALKTIGNPLVIVSLGGNCSRFLCSSSIFLDLKAKQSKDDMYRLLFPKVDHDQPTQGKSAVAKPVVANLVDIRERKPLKITSSEIASIANEDNNNTQVETEGDLRTLVNNFWDGFDAFMLETSEKDGSVRSCLTNSVIKVVLEKKVHLLNAVVGNESFLKYAAENVFEEANAMLKEMRDLLAALNGSEHKVDGNMVPLFSDLFKKLQLRKSKLEPYLNQMISSNAATTVLAEAQLSFTGKSPSLTQDNVEESANETMAEENEIEKEEEGEVEEDSRAEVLDENTKNLDTKENNGKGKSKKKNKNKGKGKSKSKSGKR